MSLLQGKLLGLFLLFVIAFINVNAQIIKIPKSNLPQTIKFDSIEYNSENKISGVFQTRDNQKHGWAIEMDEKGLPFRLGTYQFGKKSGIWEYAYGGFQTFDKKSGKEPIVLSAGCGSGMYQEIQQFYAKLMALLSDNLDLQTTINQQNDFLKGITIKLSKSKEDRFYLFPVSHLPIFCLFIKLQPL